MARKTKQKSKKKKNNNWIIVLLITIAILLIIGLFYQSNSDIFKFAKQKPLSEQKQADNKKEESNKVFKNNPRQNNITSSQEKRKETPSSKISQNSSLIGIKDLEVPAELIDRPSQIIRHAGYIVSYNGDWKIPNWVAYELTAKETNSIVKRTNKFIVDPNVKNNSAQNSDYSKSGYDRGHMAPAADMGWSETTMKESFYFSNMCPQVPSLNRGIWKNLEDKCRDWAIRDSAILITTGPINIGAKNTIGKNKVLIPSHFYKVIVSPFGRKAKGIGFIIKNEGSLESIKKFAVPIDSIEKLTEIDFFHLLPDSIEESVESNYTISDWF
ncbi:MAG: DNA/RNA non-specific endonuclease [Bacteroidales bacterium]|nr:DNA/RNA non-specific endonuclease [Bacteroidales bacterium]